MHSTRYPPQTLKKMTRNFTTSHILLFCCMLLFFAHPTLAQSGKVNQKMAIDSLSESNKVRFFLNNPSTWVQNSINKLNSLLLPSHSEIDTFSIQNKLNTISATGDLIKENLDDNSSSLRMKYIIEFDNELQTDLDLLVKIQNDLQKQNDYLTNKSFVAMGIAAEVEYFNLHADSTIKAIYKHEIKMLNAKIDETDAYLSKRLMRLVNLEALVNTISFRLQENSKYAKKLIEEKSKALYVANYPPIWKASPTDFDQSFFKVIVTTYLQSLESMQFFITHGHLFQVMFRLFLSLLCLIPLYNFFSKNKELFGKTRSLKYLGSFPLIASMIMGLTLVPFLFIHAPFIFLDTMFLLQIILLSFIIFKKYNYLPKNSFYFVIGCYILLKGFNMLVAPTFLGRIYMGMAIVVLIPLYYLYQDLKSHHKDKSKLITIIFFILGIQMVVSWFLALLGYFLLGRYYFIGALDSLVLGISLYIFSHTIMDYIKILTTLINKKLKLFYLHQEITENYFGKLLAGLSVVVFIYSLMKSYLLYDQMKFTVLNWTHETRQLGSSTFTFHSIFLFFAYLIGTMLLASFINKLIDTNDNQKHYKRRTYLGSFMLLFRFVLISIGFVLAIIASGIPVTQLTVLIGALGVGIGFGLQNIFNNMVSGLIIAIEKPISVGDMIDVGTNSGWVKGIGIRSSNIQSFDGAEIIVPNGEIISNRITNWTLSDKKRRMEILIGVAYKSDPHQVYGLFSQILDEHPEILKSPEYFIVFTGMGDSSLDFRICFWIADFIEGVRIKSEVLFRIFDTLKANNIEIPFPQHDLHLRSIGAEVLMQVAPKKEK